MILRSRIVVFLLVIALSACTSRPATLAAETARPEPLLEHPAAPTNTAAPILSLETETLPPTIPTPTETNAVDSLAQLLPKSLTGPAPWLVFPCSKQEGTKVLTVANYDGTGCVPFPVPPELPADRAWMVTGSEKGSYLAFRVKTQPVNESTASTTTRDRYRLEQNGLDDQLWIVKLPENRIIRKITQIDRDGWQRIRKMWENPTSAGAVPHPLAIILDSTSYRWSPNGRNLAYTAVDKEGIDLFVYDVLTDTSRRMSRGRQGAFFWSWSPDSKWIVYHDMARCQMERTGCRLERGLHYFAVTLPRPEYQFEDNFLAGDIDWIAKNRYILHDIPGDDRLSHRLVEVNLHTGSVTNLYEGPFYSYTYVPKTYVTRQERYLLGLPAEPASDRVAGIYDLYLPPARDRLKPFHTGDYARYTIQWERTIERFILTQDATPGPPVQKYALLISILFQDPIPLGVLGTSNLSLSPDGNWFTTKLGSGSWVLFSKQGNRIRELGQALPGQEKPVYWRKDSSGFTYFASGETCRSESGCIYRFDKEQSWEPVLIDSFQGKSDIVQVIEP